MLNTLQFLNNCRTRISRLKRQKLALPYPYSGLLQRASVDNANLAALGLPLVIYLSTVFVHILLFVMNKCNNSLKLSIADAANFDAFERSGIECLSKDNGLFNERLLQSKYNHSFYFVHPWNIVFQR